ncbi:LexA/Signal peptidase [Dacryopinax primogenitus]|uniref:Mitochondrial inner membrane protease subunit n=1 Tax=Dacryopinax primogenitus (strain DJM 731) TaxID=1858805 RepID=M5G9N3_DACPD|nr:LexA/Signal peptidase [Dacryopinax primogenitus]EJU00528.1 LexA/Signal peptidase [Dacryopinax primogenitus]
MATRWALNSLRYFVPSPPPRGKLLYYTKRTLQLCGLVWCIEHWFFDLRLCVGASMLPTMRCEPTLALALMYPSLLRPPSLKLGDLVVARSPTHPRKEVCKRVIGLPGDTVCVDPIGAVRGHGGWEDAKGGKEHVVVPRGHVWLAGDNMSASVDSRMFGPVSLGLVRGKIVFRIWPNWGPLGNTFHELDIDPDV